MSLWKLVALFKGKISKMFKEADLANMVVMNEISMWVLVCLNMGFLRSAETVPEYAELEFKRNLGLALIGILVLNFSINMLPVFFGVIVKIYVGVMEYQKNRLRD